MGRPYPKQYVGHYPALQKWLGKMGHTVYSYEMTCDAVPVNKGALVHVENSRWGKPYDYQPRRWLYGHVDVVSFKNKKLYAWEYKSASTSLKRGLAQVWNYSRSFDYVCLASVNMPHGALWEAFLSLGSGIYAELECDFEEIEAPRLQSPDPPLHGQVLAR